MTDIEGNYKMMRSVDWLTQFCLSTPNARIKISSDTFLCLNIGSFNLMSLNLAIVWALMFGVLETNVQMVCSNIYNKKGKRKLMIKYF